MSDILPVIMAEDKALEPVTGIKENGAEDKETAKDPKDHVAVAEKADTENLEEMQVDKDPAKGLDIIDEKVNENDNVEHNDDEKEEKNEKNEAVEKNDLVAEEVKSSDTAKEKDEVTETVEKEVEKENDEATEAVEKKVEKENYEATEAVEMEVEKESESEKPDDIEGKKDGVVGSNGMSAEVEESKKDSVEEKELKKPGKGKSGIKKANDKSKDVQEPKTPAVSSFSIDRPVRERKSVERLVAVIERDSSKEFYIDKGSGTALKDIPNVAYKLSKRKNDDTLKLLHSILFSRRGKAADIKQNISKFSGFVWHGNEEKQKLKIKEKLDKCRKEKLFEFCDILDIAIASKATIKKDEVLSMMLEFLVSPHATTEELLAEKEESGKGIKRKRTDKGTPGSASTKSRKKRAETGKTDEKTNSAETEDESAEDTKETEDGAQDEALTVPETNESSEELLKKSLGEEKLSGPDNQTDEVTKNQKRKRTPKKQYDSDAKTPKRTSNSKKTTSASTTETSEGKTKKNASLKKSSPSTKATPRSSKKPKVDADKGTGPKVSSKKLKDAKPVKEKNVTASNEKAGKVVSKGKEKTGEEEVKLTDERLREEACKILKEVDFNTATFTDIVKILAERFKTDLTPRKPAIKVMIQEELTKLANEEDEANEESEGEAREEPQASTPKDEAPTSTSQKV